MELTEEQITEKYGKQCLQSHRNHLLPYESEWTSFSCN